MEEDICSMKQQKLNDSDSNELVINSTKARARMRTRKRKRESSGSSTENLPDNILEVEKNLQASALKNNLDDASVKKILKKVVTNDHVLALVKMREEEETELERKSQPPKLTRAKVRELKKISPQIAPWNLELTPIKHIPVKTRPEVHALIAQDLPEDEDDEEYEPNNDDIPSDDDQTMETCSDLDSQPRTPATPGKRPTSSPKVVKDGPFKVPQLISTKRNAEDETEEATIALRTRSKLCLSETPIEHIESSFVPPDDVPLPIGDDLWNQFLTECLDPASTSRHEDDDEADPEYNVAADPDAAEEDEALEYNNSTKLSRITKKELNDLVTELFNIMPETVDDEEIANTITQNLLPSKPNNEGSYCVSKQKPVMDGETVTQESISSNTENTISTNKTPEDRSETQLQQSDIDTNNCNVNEKQKNGKCTKKLTRIKSKPVEIRYEEKSVHGVGLEKCPEPAVLRSVFETDHTYIEIHSGVKMLPEQRLILEQQLRQHVQLATSNFLQLFIHPVQWSYAHKYKEYLESFQKMVDKNPESVVNVCNLKPAVDLIHSWEISVSEATPENQEMVQFIKSECERSRRRCAQSHFYVGEFHDTFKNVVINSTVFLYPYLLPSMPYRADNLKKFSYLRAEDEYIALGLEQFGMLVDNNQNIFRSKYSLRCGLSTVVQLVTKHMMPWISPKSLMGHIHHIRKMKDIDNPIYKYLNTKTIEPMKHELLPFNPQLTMYEQPESEMPRIWLRHLAKTSKRFKNYLYRRTRYTGRPAAGVSVDIGKPVEPPQKEPLPPKFISKSVPIVTINSNTDPQTLDVARPNPAPAPVLYNLVETTTGAYLVPMSLVPINNVSTAPTTSTTTTTTVTTSTIIANNLPENSKMSNIEMSYEKKKHCRCCSLLRNICKGRQTFITDYFRSQKEVVKTCPCKVVKHKSISNRLKLLLSSFKSDGVRAYGVLKSKLNEQNKDDVINTEDMQSQFYADDLAIATSYHLNLVWRTSTYKNKTLMRQVHQVFSRFSEADSPVWLARKLDSILGYQFVDLYKAFFGFLTPAQAVELNNFKDYFWENCFTNLIKAAEKNVTDKTDLYKILRQLTETADKLLVDSNPCTTCCKILDVLDRYPKLARYAFSLFPHNISEESVDEEEPPKPSKEPEVQPQLVEENCRPENSHSSKEDNEQNLNCGSGMDFDGDNFSSEEEETVFDSVMERTIIEQVKVEQPNEDQEESYSDNVTDTQVISKNEDENNYDIDEIRDSKLETNDYDSSSYMSTLMMSDEEDYIKVEVSEWNRDEDKLILELLKQSCTPEDRKDKTIMEIIDDKELIHLIADSLLHKSVDDIKERILYLLDILAVGENLLGK